MRNRYIGIILAVLFVIPSAAFAQSGQSGEICIPDEQRQEPSRHDILSTCFSQSGSTLIFSVNTGGGDDFQGPDAHVEMKSPGLWLFYGNDDGSGAARNYQDEFGGVDVENCDRRLTFARTSTVAQWTVPEDCMPPGDYRFTATTSGPYVAGDTAAPISVTVYGASPEPTPTPTTEPTAEPTAEPTYGPIPEPTITRLSGASRFETAVRVSQRSWPNGNNRLALANAYSSADALSAHNLAGYAILFVNECSIPTVVEDEIYRLGPDDIVLIGGTSVLCDEMRYLASDAATGAVY